ncbi:hypothetical protein [Pseudoxanthomonas mexicana]
MTKLPVLALLCSSLLLPLAAHAGDGCDGLPNWQQLKQALANARKDANGGFNLDMWAPWWRPTARFAPWPIPAPRSATSGSAAG